MNKQQKRDLELSQVCVQLQNKQINELDGDVIPALRESGRKFQRSEVIRTMVNILVDAVPFLDGEALAEGEALEVAIVRAIVKAEKRGRKQ